MSHEQRRAAALRASRAATGLTIVRAALGNSRATGPQASMIVNALDGAGLPTTEEDAIAEYERAFVNSPDQARLRMRARETLARLAPHDRQH